MKKTQARISPTSTAIVRSNTTVSTKVPTRIVRYWLLNWRSRTNSCHSPMFQATNSRMPASTASGTCCARGATASTISKMVIACTMPATGEVAPARRLVTVRAIVPVAGMPPKNGATKFATPCAISSWLGSCLGSLIMLSAMRAHISDSIAPSSAIVIVGITSCLADSQLNGGRLGSGEARAFHGPA